MRRVLLVFGVYLAALDGIVPLQAAVIAPAFSGSYTLSDLGSASGVATPYGGIVFKAGDPNTILLGSSANDSGGAIDSIGVSRDAGHHITGFTGTAALFATAPNIDGGLAYGPGGVLFYTAYPINTIGEIKPGSAVPNKLVDPTPLGIASSVGTLAFVPPGFPGAGDFKIASYSGGGFYDATLSPDGSGTFNISSATLITTPGGGPEGVAYVPMGSPLFTSPSLLLGQYDLNKVSAYELDANGNPNLATRRDFVTGLTGAEGATIDPLTGDFLFSTFVQGGTNEVFLVRGFTAPTAAVPEPSSLFLFTVGGPAVAFFSARRKRPPRANGILPSR